MIRHRHAFPSALLPGLLTLFQLVTPAALSQQAGKIGQVTLFGEEPPRIEAATKTAIPISKAPSSVTVITAKQIRESGARTIPDLLRLVAGVNVRWNPMGQTIDVRGFGENPFSNRLLLLIDGIPYNSGDTGGFPSSPSFDLFPLQNVKRIEVVRGPGSSLYGENAFWGVINVVSLSGEDLAGGEAGVYAGSLSTSSVTAQYGTRSGVNSIFGSVRALRSQFPIAFWQDDGSKYRASDIFLKGGHRDLQLSLYRYDDKLDGFSESFPPSAGLPATAVFASAHQLRQTLDIAALRYNHSPQGAAFTYAADVSWSHRNGMHCAGCHASPERPEFQQRADHGYQAIGDFRLGLHMFPGHDVLAGVEARRLNRGDHKQELSEAGNVVSGYDKVAFYAQDQFSLVRDRLSAVAGIRYDNKTKLFNSRTSPRVALVYTPNERFAMRGGYSTAFRFPSFSELYQSSWFFNVQSDRGAFPAIPFSIFKPNPDIQPEEVRTIDLGGEYQLTTGISARADIYRSRVRKFIVFTSGGAPATFGVENHPAGGVVTGGELEIRSNFRQGITGFTNWAYQKGSQSGSGTDSNGRGLEFSYAPRNKINAGAYAGPFNGFRASGEVAWRDKYTGPQFWYLVASGFRDPTVRPQSSYTLVNGRVSYEIPLQASGKDRPVRLSLFGNNLLDRKPRETVIGVDTTLAGRQIFAQLEVHF